MQLDRESRALGASEEIDPDAQEGLAIFEIIPAPAPRVVGPGRIERRYVAALAGLEAELAASRRALEVAGIVERGASSLFDRLEADLVRAREREREREGIEKRLIFTLGALQRENELLRAARAPIGTRHVGALAARRAFERRASSFRPEAGWLARIFGRRR